MVLPQNMDINNLKTNCREKEGGQHVTIYVHTPKYGISSNCKGVGIYNYRDRYG